MVTTGNPRANRPSSFTPPIVLCYTNETNFWAVLRNHAKFGSGQCYPSGAKYTTCRTSLRNLFGFRPSAYGLQDQATIWR